MITSRTALSTSPRRVVVVRNPRPQVDQGPVYVEELRRSDTIDRPPVITDGVSVLFIDRIFRSKSKKYFRINKLFLCDGLQSYMKHLMYGVLSVHHLLLYKQDQDLDHQVQFEHIIHNHL